MELYILHEETRDIIDMIDSYESVLWIPRYNDVGQFEIYTPANEKTLSLLKHDRYVKRLDSDMVGIIEKVRIETTAENGDYIIATGQSLESIIARRVVWSMTNVSGTVEKCLLKLFNENIINPAQTYRKIDDFVFTESGLGSESVTAQYTGDNLLDVTQTLCKLYGYGFKVTLNDENQFDFKLYKGVNRSYTQNENSFVVFSPSFENIVSSNYEHDKTPLKNCCRIGGEGEGSARVFTELGDTLRGLERREVFVDARDVSRDNGETSLTLSEYETLLIARGDESLVEYSETTLFEGEVESQRQFIFGRDFFLGDIVTVQNEYGITGHPRIVEILESDDSNGRMIIPTFEEMQMSSPAYLVTESDKVITTNDGDGILVER